MPTLGRPEYSGLCDDEGPGGKRDQPLKVYPPEGSNQSVRVASPANGVRGKPPVSTGTSQVLTEGGPGNSFVPF